jgi:hypothetical protein
VWGHLSGGPLKCLDLLGFCGRCVVLALICESGGGGNRTRVRKPSATASTHAFPGTTSHPPNLPGRARRMFAWFSFAYSSSRRGRMETIPHRDALHHHRGRVMGGRWPVIRRPGLLHNRWRLCGFPLFYEACGALGMQLYPHEPPSKSFRPLCRDMTFIRQPVRARYRAGRYGVSHLHACRTAFSPWPDPTPPWLSHG